MSALAAISGFVVWIAVLSLPLAVYFLVVLIRRGREVNQAHWADLRAVRGLPPDDRPEVDSNAGIKTDLPETDLLKEEEANPEAPKKTG